MEFLREVIQNNPAFGLLMEPATIELLTYIIVAALLVGLFVGIIRVLYVYSIYIALAALIFIIITYF